ncbi:MAG: FecR domain-containing protein [Candidatus Rifleibacteriota bacterium]
MINKRFFLIAVLAMLMISGIVSAQHDKFLFKTIEGRAVLSRTGGSTWLALQSTQPVEVRPGDLINVEGSGRGELFYPDGTIVRLKNNAMITIMRSGIQLKLGNVWLKVRRRSDMFKVFTPLGSCTVLGTSFDVNVDRYGHTDIRVFSGIVAVRAAEDQRNRQLVLQNGMLTKLTQKDKIAESPERFQSSTIEAALISEWESRDLPAAPKLLAEPAQKLPPIRPEIETEPITLPPVEQVISGEFREEKAIAARNPIILARQRSAFLDHLREQTLQQDSVIGGRFEEKEEMHKDGHNRELGQHVIPAKLIRNRNDLDREYANTRNRILRVQSQMRQKELEMNSIIVKSSGSSVQQRAVASLQSELLGLREEHRALVQKLRDLENLKR